MRVDGTRAAMPDPNAPDTFYDRLHLPLAEAIRPRLLAEYIGQDHLLNKSNGEIANFLRLGYLPSMILHGPPGVGKTSLARLLADEANYVYMPLSATDSTIDDVRELLTAVLSENRKRSRRLRLVVFIDEIHRFSKVQQDFLLPFVEAGLFVLIGATTIEPTKRVRRAILSRCQLFELQGLQDHDVERVAKRGILFENARRRVFKTKPFGLSDSAMKHLVRYAAGDMRKAILLIEILSVQSSEASEQSNVIDGALVMRQIESVSKSRLGLHSEDNVRLLDALDEAVMKCMVKVPQRNLCKVRKSQDAFIISIRLPPRLRTGPAENLSKIIRWNHDAEVSDDSDVEPGELYSDDEDSSSHFFAAKMLLALEPAATPLLNAVLLLLRRGESPLYILKRLLLQTCNWAHTDTSQLRNIMLAVKASRLANVRAENVVSNCFRAVVRSAHQSHVPLLEPLKKAKAYHALTEPPRFSRDEVINTAEVVFDKTFAEDQLTDIATPVKSTTLSLPIVPLEELGAAYVF